MYIVSAMSISYKIYNSDPEHSDMSKWECDHFGEIGMPDNVITSLNHLFLPRKLAWDYSSSNTGTTPYVGYYSALITGEKIDTEQEYIDLKLTVHKDGYVCEISARKASPKLLQIIMEEFSLKYVFEMSGMELINPYLYEGNWVRIDEKH